MTPVHVGICASLGGATLGGDEREALLELPLRKPRHGLVRDLPLSLGFRVM